MLFRTFGAACLAVLLSAVSWAAELDRRVAQAAMNGDKAGIEALLAEKADVNAPMADGTTALHWAAHWNDAEMVDLLLRAGADPKTANTGIEAPLGA